MAIIYLNVCWCFYWSVAWSYWWTWCVLPIIWNSKHFSFLVFYYNVSNKFSSIPPRLLNYQFPHSLFIPTPNPPSPPPSIRHSGLFVQKSVWHFGVAWLISQYFSLRDLKPVAFLAAYLKRKLTIPSVST